MKVLITGITGFVGSHLAEYILDNFSQIEIHGLKRHRSKMENIEHLDGKLRLHDCDIKDAHNVYFIIEEVKPDFIFHLAAQSYVPTSWEAPAETLHTNIIGQTNLFEAVRKFRAGGYDPVIQIAGSSEEYGLVFEKEIPIREDNPLRPLSPYAVSKVTQDYLAYQYFKTYGLRTIRTRAFNHSGPRRGEVFVDSNFAKQIALIEKGKKEPVISVGNLEAVRDFTDVRDIVIAYWLSVKKCKPGEVYNISSGKGWRIKDVLTSLIKMSTKQEIKIKQDPQRMRPSDNPILVGDSSKFRKETGWRPKISYEETLQAMLDYWRERV